jgi:serine protease Do
MSEDFRNNQYEENPVDPEKKDQNQRKQDKDLKKILARAAAIALVVGVVGGGAFTVTRELSSQAVSQKTVAEAAGKETETLETEVAPASSEKTSLVNTSDTGNSDTVLSVQGVAAYAMPGMVAITNQGVQEVQDYFFGQTYQQEFESSGTGVLIGENEEELLIATNNHVVEGAETLTVCFSVDADDKDSLVVPATIKGTDPNHDLAVIAVKMDDIAKDIKEKIRILEIGSSADLQLGEQVVAIGNALGYGQSVTSGYVSALDREVTVDNITNNMIQTDASINPGNSGGALLNMRGQLIGINSVKASQVGVEGMGYAIPIDTAMPILDELKNIQAREIVDEDKRGYMGMIPRDVTMEARQIYQFPAGAFVYEVTEGSAAEKAGLKRGDIITKMDGVIISSANDLYNRMQYYAAGDELILTIQRVDEGEYKEQELTVVLDKRPKDTSVSSGSQQNQDSDEEEGRSRDDNYGQDEERDTEESMDPFSQIFPEYFVR